MYLLSFQLETEVLKREKEVIVMWLIPEDYSLTRDMLEAGFLFHGHRCPGFPLGVRAGLLAMKTLGVKRSGDKQLHVILEVGPSHAMHCFGDGVQFATGCTFGKGNIEKISHGKLAFRLIDKATGNAVRIIVKPEVLREMSKTKFVAERRRGVPADQVKREYADEAIEKILSFKDDELFTVKTFKYEGSFPKGTFRTYICPICGELFFETAAMVRDGQIICRACYHM